MYKIITFPSILCPLSYPHFVSGLILMLAFFLIIPIPFVRDHKIVGFICRFHPQITASTVLPGQRIPSEIYENGLLLSYGSLTFSELLLSSTKSVMQPRRHITPAKRKVVVNPVMVAMAAPIVPVAAVPMPVDVE